METKAIDRKSKIEAITEAILASTYRRHSGAGKSRWADGWTPGTRRRRRHVTARI